MKAGFTGHLLSYIGLPWWLSGKGSTCHAKDPGSIPGLGRSPGEWNGNPLQYSYLENSMDRGAWWATQFMGLQRVGHNWVIEHSLSIKVRVTHLIAQISQWKSRQGKGLPKVRQWSVRGKKGAWYVAHLFSQNLLAPTQANLTNEPSYNSINTCK